MSAPVAVAPRQPVADGRRLFKVGQRMELRTLPDGRRYWCVAPDDEAIAAAARDLAVIANSVTS